MTELEAATASNEIVDATESKACRIWRKIKKMITEIITIVFGVSVSIAFHGWSEARHEKHEVDNFFRGLRKDLKKDILEMNTDIAAYKKQKKAFSYFSNIPKGKAVSQDSLKVYSEYFYTFTGYGRNTGRYEGFKSSGKIGYIENDSLQNDILDLYEESIPILSVSTDFYKNQKLKFAEYITEHTVDYPEGNFTKILASDPIKNRSRIYLSSVDRIIGNYQSSIQLMDKIIKQIDEEVPVKTR